MSEIEIIKQSEGDYKIYVTLCTENNIAPVSIHIFAQKFGMIYVASKQYVDMPLKTAYMQFIMDMNSKTASFISTSPESSTGCSSCGGGKVL